MAENDKLTEKKAVLVTGASGGIGAEIALQAARAGYFVVAHYRNGKEKTEKLIELIKSEGFEAEAVQFDIADRKQCFETIESLIDKYGAFWGVVNNAGVNHDGTFAGLSPESWDSVVHTNLDSFYNVIQPFVMPMCRKKRGRIICISSVSGIMGNRGQTNYSASKAGIIGASKALAVELASRGITVNTVAPGVIETDMVKDLDMDRVLPSIPMNRLGRAEDVAALVVFLLSEQAGYITRQVISVNGGMV